jgi:Protein of unknown function (DUF1553)/Protein of unknown function (DUF1549)/Planctomycete cytochrome C
MSFRGVIRGIALTVPASLGGVWLALSQYASADENGAEFFEKRIRPVLVERCYECHSAQAKKLKGGLRLDTREGLSAGGDSGAAIVPGNPEESLLIKSVRRLDKDLSMPPKEALDDSQVADLIAWVKMGAPDPRATSDHADAPPEKPPYDFAAARRQWAFHKPEPVTPPATAGDWVRNPVDAFILKKLDEKKIAPAPAADRGALLRRVTFDLIGLPPTPTEIADFLADSSPNAFGKVVERLLASPRYGERWARHWLDVVRYTDSLDTRGFGGESDVADAWRYRDWVASAFNRDLPYDQFVTQQIAGDLLAEQPGAAFDPAKIVATGMYAIGNWGTGDADKEKVYTDIVDDQIDVTGRAFLGLTLACARCHDHKFDPIPTADYYGLAGIFFSSRILDKFAAKTAGENPMRIPLLSPAELAKREFARKRIPEIDAQLAHALRPLTEENRNGAGSAGLIGWRLPGADNPSLTINPGDRDVTRGTVKLPARSVVLHPGPRSAVSAVWRSPEAGTVRISARVSDADPHCGDGIEWAVCQSGKPLASGVLEKGKSAEFVYETASVAKEELLALVVRPRANYSCDSTRVEWSIRSQDGRVWDLKEALLKPGGKNPDGAWAICAGEGTAFADSVPDAAPLLAERLSLAEAFAPPPECHGLREGGIPQTAYEGFHDARVHVRGRYDRLGPLTPRHLPVLLAGENQPPIRDGSGRLALARWVSSPDNPLTARVMMNRIWQHHFGEGIVRTPNNFGKLGVPPTHPELLDWLAGEFVKSGWSIKAMHRLICNSATYQQASSSTDAARDPDNLLFGRQNRRRLEAEALRDSMLFTAGRLDLQEGGPSVRDLMAPRRTFYITSIRADRATYQMLFDAADPSAIVERRTESTVAPQALWLLNHPFALAQAGALARRAQTLRPDDPARVRWLYESLYARPPTDREIAIGLRAVTGGADAAWDAYCQILFCANEFSYID